MAISDHQKYRMEHQLLQLSDLTNNLDRNFIKKRNKTDKWSIHENMAHLGSYQEHFKERLTTIMSINNPGFSRYKAEDDNDFQLWCMLSPEHVMEKLLKSRTILNDQILGFSSSQLQRTGEHPKLGKMTVPEWIDFFLLHESHHIYTIFWLKHEFI